MKISSPILVALLATLALATAATAQVTFTITGTADSTAGGYNTAQSYTFVFTTLGGFLNNPNSTFSSTTNFWNEEFVSTDAQLFTSISGSGLLGTFVRPTAGDDDPYSQLFTTTDDPSALDLFAGADNSTSLGLTTLNSTSFQYIAVETIGLPAFSFPGAYSTPDTYFTDAAGSFSANGAVRLRASDFDTIVASFTVTNVAISAAAIPEPSTYAAFAGLAAFGLALRHKARAGAGNFPGPRHSESRAEKHGFN